MLLTAVTVQAQQLSGKIVDAVSGEALPYVKIKSTNGKQTQSNAEGEFLITCNEEDTLKLSLMGYVSQGVRAKRNLKTIKMQPSTIQLKEVQIEAINPNSIISEVIKKLEKDYKKNKSKKRTYFYRSLLNSQEDSYMIEAFMNAKSALNLRSERILSGITGMSQDGNPSNIPLKVSNIHNQAQIAPKTYQSVFWEHTIKPLSDMATVKKYYHTRLKTFYEENGDKFYRIDFRWKDEMNVELGERRYMTGGMIVDASNFRLLRFEGKIGNAFQWVQFSHLPSNISFQIEYDYQDGYAAVSHLNINGGNELLQYHTLVYGIHDDETLKRIKGIKKKNTIEAVQMAGSDSTVWQQYEIVKRTREESSILRGEKYEKEADTPLDTIHSQNPNLQKILQRMCADGKLHPREKVYVHIDNNCYFLGDTIWFSAYTRDTYFRLPSQISQVLYVELYSPDGFLVERKNIQLEDGRGHGEFALNKPLMYSGFYELRAYTRWQLNWGVTKHHHGKNSSLDDEYYRDYDKIYTRVFPIYDKPADGDVESRNMTVRPMRRHFREDPDKRQAELHFYPEGGNLVEEVPCRVAFEAKWSDGESIDGVLFVDNDSIPTTHRGRGVFTITPRSDKTNTIQFADTHGNIIKGKLPKVLEEGIALSVTHTDSLWKFNILRSKNITSSHLAFSVMNEGNLLLFRPIEGDSTTWTFGQEKFLPGINQLTVFDDNGQILADRLFFVHGTQTRQPNITCITQKQEYEPLERIDIQISTLKRLRKPSEAISISIKDADGSVVSNDDCNILTEMLLSSDIKGFIPQPQWYFEQEDELHQNALDLLMMTQGWRRYDWRQIACDSIWAESQPREKAPILRGTIHRLSQREGQQAGIAESPELYIRCIAVRTDMEKPETNTSMIKVQDDGRFQIEYNNLLGTGTLFLDIMENENSEQHLFNLRDDYYIRIHHPFPRFVKPYTHYQNNLINEYIQDKFLTTISSDTIHQMAEVRIREKSNGLRKFDDSKPAIILGSLEAENIVIDAGVGTKRPIPYTSLIEALFGDLGMDFPYVHEMGAEGQSFLSNRRLHRYGLSNTRRVMEGLDNIPEDSLYSPKYLKSYSAEFPFSPGELKELESASIEKYIIYTDYCPRLEGSNRYSGTNLPEIIVAEYPYTDGSVVTIPAQRCLSLPTMAQPSEFYNPDYSKHRLPEGQKDYRRTLYWNPNLQLDENGEAHIQFYNNSRTSHLSIEAEGQASDGTLLFN